MNASLKHWPAMMFCRIPAAAQTELFATLESLLPLSFSRPEAAVEAAGELRLPAPPGDGAPAYTESCPSLTVACADAAVPEPEHQADIEVRFADDPEVPLPFRGRRLATRVVAARRFLALRANERVLATSLDGPIWTLAETAGAKHFRSALPLPSMGGGRNFSDIFGGERFLEMLPLLHFLRGIVSGALPRTPPLRAAYIIDDPNLHWPRYGCVDYREIAARAQRENYHVAFATIPLDAWFAHGGTAELFRRNPQRLSLLVHGNNHARNELAGRYSPAVRDGLLRQALRRIERLERKTKLNVCRVMVPPHGACSSEMLAALPRNGFAAACISAGSLRAHNPDKAWTQSLGFRPSEIIEDCPVLPRWGLTGSVENTLLVAAYLGRPMILRGHHLDLKDGPDVLDHYARFINGLGEVVWSSLSGLSRMNYLYRQEGTALRLTPLAPHITVDLPEFPTEVVIDSFGAGGECTWRVAGADGWTQTAGSGEPVPLPEEAGRRLSIERQGPPAPAATGLEWTSARLICRRILAETRDRLQGIAR